MFGVNMRRNEEVIHLLVGVIFGVLNMVLIQWEAAVRGEARPQQNPYISTLFIFCMTDRVSGECNVCWNVGTY
jgi:hypothetical protein